MTDTIQETLTAQFGFTTFQPGQREVIEYLMAGKSAAAVFPTGGGKSLCYQLPALLLPGLTLVVSPLIALMKDQLDALTSRGIAAARIDSTLDGAAYRETMDRLRARELRLLYVAPERFNNERFRAAMQQSRISLFAVDEAHCISEWGHNFRPDYLKLAEFAKNSGAERCLALTATATPAVLDDICRVFGIESEAAIRTGFYRPNLHLRFTPVDVSRRNALLIDRLSAGAGHRLCHAPADGGRRCGDSLACWPGSPRLSCRHGGRPAQRRSGLVHAVIRRHCRGDDCLRHGHR